MSVWVCRFEQLMHPPSNLSVTTAKSWERRRHRFPLRTGFYAAWLYFIPARFANFPETCLLKLTTTLAEMAFSHKTHFELTKVTYLRATDSNTFGTSAHLILGGVKAASWKILYRSLHKLFSTLAMILLWGPEWLNHGNHLCQLWSIGNPNCCVGSCFGMHYFLLHNYNFHQQVRYSY